MKTTTNSCHSKIHPNKDGRIVSVFNSLKSHEADFSSIKITSEKVHRSNDDFLLIEITPKDLHRNDVAFSLIKITPNNVHRNGENYSLIEIIVYKVNVHSVQKRRRFFLHQHCITKITKNNVEIH